MSDAVLSAEGLRLELATGHAIVEEVSLTVSPGEVLGIVGESGSGKTTTALALMGHQRAGIRRTAGTVIISGEEITAYTEGRLRRARGRLISYVPQEPAMALNPSIRIGDQITNMLRGHANDTVAVKQGVKFALSQVDLPSDSGFVRRFPHQLSGGQQQRVAIAIALVCKPAVVVLDEPTTGLDVVVQRGILAEIARLAAETGLGIVYVSHDLAVVGSIAHRIAVMYAGRIVEDGPASELIRSPKHPYTHGLVSAIPDPLIPRRLRGIPGLSVGVEERDRGCAFAPRCQFQIPTCLEAMPALAEVTPQHRSRCIRWAETPAPTIEPPFDPPADGDRGPLLEVRSLNASHKSRFGKVVAAQDVSFSVALGECVALVGESGSGKTTIARCIVGLHAPDAGEIQLDGEQLSKSARSRPVEARRRVQIVFQNPYDSLNPRHTTGQIIERPARQLRRLSQADARLEMRSLLGLVRLPARTADRYPSELSGGERQRVAIARALAAKPSLLVCDEITSALDVSVQAAVLELIAELRQELGLSLLFISHDLGVVGSISDRILVLRTGRVREEGRAASVLEHPADEYTRQLIAAAPRLDGLDPAPSRSPDTEESR